MSNQPFHKLTGFLKQLDQAHIHYVLASHREDAIMVLVSVPGERWEVEFLDDGSVEIERFTSSGEIGGEKALRELFTRFTDPEPASLLQ